MKYTILIHITLIFCVVNAYEKQETTQNPQQQNNTVNQRNITQTAEALGSEQKFVNPHYFTWCDVKWEEFYQHYNEFGILRSFERDHYWKKFSPETLNFFKVQLASDVKNYDNLPELIELNKSILASRWCLKEDLAESIDAPSEAQRPAYIDELLYKLVDRCQEQASIPGVLQELSHLTLDSNDQQSHQLCQLFFEASGVCKLIGMPESRKILMRDVTIDERIHYASNLAMRNLLNYFASQPLKTPDKIEWIRRGIHYCLRACELDAVGQAYQELAAVQFYAYLNQTNRLILYCGDFTQALETPAQRDMQKNITLRFARLISSLEYTDADAVHMLKIAVVETARQFNSEGNLEAATQALALLDHYEKNENDEDLCKKMSYQAPQLISSQERYSDGKFERICIYELANTYGPELSFTVDDHQINDPELDERISELLRKYSACEDAERLAQE